MIPLPTAPLSVVQSGDRMVYVVSSEAKPGLKYRVDLLSYDGRGECSCKDWSTRRGPAVKAGQKSFCKHVAAARSYFLDGVLEAMAKSETAP